MEIKAVIIDDETSSINHLGFELKKHCPEMEIVATAENADDGMEIIMKYNPDIVFLDIQMPEKSGLDLLASLYSNPFEVIFVTGFDQYLMQAARFSAIDYLLKPVMAEDLKRAVWRAVDRSSNIKRNLLLMNLLEMQRQQNMDKHRIPLFFVKKTRFEYVKDIIRIESANSYSTIYLVSGEKLIQSSAIFEFEIRLRGYGFIRCHQRHLINKRHVKESIRDGVNFLHLEGGSEVPVSRNHRQQVLEELEKDL